MIIQHFPLGLRTCRSNPPLTWHGRWGHHANHATFDGLQPPASRLLVLSVFLLASAFRHVVHTFAQFLFELPDSIRPHKPTLGQQLPEPASPLCSLWILSSYSAPFLRHGGQHYRRRGRSRIGYCSKIIPCVLSSMLFLGYAMFSWGSLAAAAHWNDDFGELIGSQVLETENIES